MTPLRTILLSGLTSAVVSVMVFASMTHIPSPQGALNAQPLQGSLIQANDSTIVQAVKRAEPAVVSVIISKNKPVLERFERRDITGDPFFDQFFPAIPGVRENGTHLQEIGGGTAFFVSKDGVLMTNKHVVSDANAQYTVLLNDGRTLQATVLGRDPVNDIALLKVEGENFPFLQLETTATPELGESVIAIGNALGEFRNTVSVGVISGLQRDIYAGNPALGESEHLSRIIQTDAAINEGNSGGPLLDARGLVIGMNTAVATNAQGIGFAIPLEDLQRTLESYKQYGRIVRPFIGIRYAQTEEQEGALILQEDESGPGVIPGSPAEKAGLREGDVLLSVDGQTVTPERSVAEIIQTKKPGDTLPFRIQRDGKEQTVPVTLEEWKENP